MKRKSAPAAKPPGASACGFFTRHVRAPKGLTADLRLAKRQATMGRTPLLIARDGDGEYAVLDLDDFLALLSGPRLKFRSEFKPSWRGWYTVTQGPIPRCPTD